ncbi:HIT family protein [Candidatus Woesearchaeota archaeon]|nr:MAG: HIT family protein [Candidatus Woesearchaeota archaeon]
MRSATALREAWTEMEQSASQEKPACDYCELISSPGAFILYEDKHVVAFLSEEPISEGSIVVVPKEHYVIIEQVPDYVVAKMFHVANKLSVAVFDSLNALGTNILIQNGVAAGQRVNHCSIEVIPRFEGDALSFAWVPKQLSEEEMSTIEIELKELCSNIGGFETEKEEPVVLDSSAPKAAEDGAKKGDSDFRKKQFLRIP